MNRHTMQRSIFCTIGTIAAISAFAGTHPAPADRTGGPSPRPRQRFVENKGQFPAQVSYRAEFGTASLFIEQDRLTWSMLQADIGERMHALYHDDPKGQRSIPVQGHAWRMRFVDPNANAGITSSDRGSAYLNYFLGSDPNTWAGHVGIFGEVRYDALWNGVDLRLRAAEGGFKYDVLLAANADVDQVRFAYEGLDALSIATDGRLILGTRVGELVEMAPVAWYADGQKEAVGCAFTLKDGVVGFSLAAGTDRRRPIVIDPLLIASTLSGTGDLGMTSNYGHSATYDASGNIYTAAICFGQGYPVTVGAFSTTFSGGDYDISISKLNADGSDLIYATYLGGNDLDVPHSMVVSAQNELVVLGWTNSSTFPTSAGAFDASFNGLIDYCVTKFTQDGSAIVGSTYVGGAQTDYFTVLGVGRGEAVTDASGNVYCAAAAGAGFPTTPGSYQPTFGGGGYDGVIFCLNNDLSVLSWSTYLGSSSEESCAGLKLDAAGDLFVTGGTMSADFPTTPGAYQTTLSGLADAYVAKLTENGSTLEVSTLFGTDQEDYGGFIQLDINGDVFVHGNTTGTMPIQPAGTYGVYDAPMFVAKFTPDLATNPMSTVVGIEGAFFESFMTLAFLVDDCGHLYLCGHLAEQALPVTADALQTSGGFYLSGYDTDMSALLFGSYYGGPADHVDGGHSRFDPSGIVYQGVCTSGGFPTTDWAWSNTQTQGWDVGVFKIDFQLSGVAIGILASTTEGCAPTTIDFDHTGNPVTVQWDFGDGSALDTSDAPSHTYDDPGIYTITLIGFDPASCNLSDTTAITIVIADPVPPVPQFTVSQAGGCEPYTVVTVNNSTGPASTYLWDMGDGSTYTTTNVTHAYPGAGTYTITLTVTDTTCGTVASASQTINVTEPVPVIAAFSAQQVDQCSGLIVSTTNLSTGPGGLVYTWDMGDGTTLTGETVTYTYEEVGIYTITLIAYDPLCDEEGTFELAVSVQASPLVDQGITPPNIFSPNRDGQNDSFFPIEGAGNNVHLTVWDRWGVKMFETTGDYRPWNGHSPSNGPVPDGVYFYHLDYNIPCAGGRVEGRESGYVHVVGSTL